MNREQTIAATVSALSKKYFHVDTFLDSNSCFDIIAKNPKTILAIKVYENIDSIRKEQADELKKLAQVLDAACIIIGKRTKVIALQENTVYYRYEIPTVTIETFKKMLDNKQPEIKYFKGKYIVDLDSDSLRKKRVEQKLSLAGLAQKIGVSQETIYRFEHGASTSLGTAKKLEKELEEDLSQKIDIFGSLQPNTKIDETPHEKLLGKLHEIGLKMAIFDHAPFHAFGEIDSGMFISTAKGKFDIPKKALELKKTTAVLGSDSIIITKEYKYKNVQGVPVIEESDLSTIKKFKELKKLIEERENK
ncbi:MAG TPA: helix-turn-helix domain-containing protein [archaeon]|nr:helix-turn-helix domain-containing protein [archaeon]